MSDGLFNPEAFEQMPGQMSMEQVEPTFDGERRDEMVPSYTAKRRARTDEYGSGREIELTATATLLDAEELAEHDLDPERPWAIILSGTETTYGPGSAVLNWNTAEWDPDGEWRHDMRATMPTEEDCRDEAESLMHVYIGEHSDENWAES